MTDSQVTTGFTTIMVYFWMTWTWSTPILGTSTMGFEAIIHSDNLIKSPRNKSYWWLCAACSLCAFAAKGKDGKDDSFYRLESTQSHNFGLANIYPLDQSLVIKSV